MPHALALAPGQFVGALVSHMIETDALEKAEGFIDVGPRKSPQPASPETYIAEPAGEHVFHHREPLYQSILLKDHTQAAAIRRKAAPPRISYFDPV